MGVAKVKLDNGTEVGKRLPLFDYSGKVILTIKDYKKKIEEELERIWNLKGNGGWVESNQIAGQLWESEALTLVKGIGEKTVEKLSAKGLVSIRDLKNCSNEQLLVLAGPG